MKSLRRYFVTGLVVLIPVALTIWILWKLSFLLEGILGRIFLKYLPQFYTPGLGFVSLLLIILLVGALASNFLGRRLLGFSEGLLAKIPLFNKIYLSVKGISDAILKKKKGPFNGVALVEVSHGIQTLAFITSPAREEIQKENTEKLMSLFIPTVPNISTGFYCVMPEKDLKRLDLSVEEALKLMLSLGLSGQKEKNEK